MRMPRIFRVENSIQQRRRFLVAAIIALLLSIVLPIVVLATATEITLTIVNQTGTTYTNAPAKVMMNNTALAAAGYTLPSQLDVLIENAIGDNLYFMPATNKTLFIAPTIGPNSTTRFYWSSDNTPRTSHEVVVGTGGYVTTYDDAALELADEFTLEVGVYINDATYTIYEKQDAIRLSYNSTTDTLTLITGTFSAPDHTLTASPVAAGYHVIKVTGGTYEE